MVALIAVRRVSAHERIISKQLCTPVPTAALPTDGVLQVEFDAATTHCSTIIAHVLVDGAEEFTSGARGPAGHRASALPIAGCPVARAVVILAV